MSRKKKIQPVKLPTDLPDLVMRPTPKAAATITKPNTDITGTRAWLPWGVEDRLPTIWREMVEDVPVAGQVIMRKAEMLYGDGIVYADANDDSPTPTRVVKPEVEAFLKRNFVAGWLVAQAMDYSLHTNVFGEIEFELADDGTPTKVVGLYHKVAEFCRLSQLHPTTNRSYYMHYSTDFWRGDKPNENRLAVLPLLQWDLPREDTERRVRARRIAYHSKMESPGTIFYGRAPWAALFRENGWLSVAADVPGLVRQQQKKNLQKTTVVKITNLYLQMRSGKMGLTPEELKKAYDDLVKDIEAQLADDELKNAPIFMLVDQDPATGEMRGGIEFEVAGNTADKDTWMPSAGQANAEICIAWGVDPNQLGVSPEGGTIGAGSGSGVREGYNLGITTNNPHQAILLRVLDWISEWNGWGVKFYIGHTEHTTKDKQESGLKAAAVPPMK